MLKTVYSALAVTALLAGTASFAADQTPAPTAAAPVAATAATPAVATPAKETVKSTTKHVEHAVKVKASKEAAAPSTESSATSTPKK